MGGDAVGRGALLPTAVTLCALFALGACDETLPTATDPSLIPVAPTTVAVELPFSEWGSDVRVLDGFGRTADLTAVIAALDFEGVFNAHGIVRFAAFPSAVQVANSAGVVVNDTSLTYVGGRVLAIVDTSTAVAPEGAATLEAASTTEHWDENSATWTMAVDTIGERIPWSEPGGGAALPFDTSTWDAAVTDTLVFEVDSATANAWADTDDSGRGLRLRSLTGGSRLEFVSVQVDVDIRPSVRPDTLVQRSVFATDNLFLYDPPPPPPEGEFRVGGAPAWRTTFLVDLPDTLNGPTALCEAAGCPFLLTSESVNFAQLVLTSAPSPPGFQPDDTLSLDVRPVLSPPDLPKSPLGSSLAGLFGVRAPPEFFGPDGAEEVEVSVTSFIQDRVRGTDEDGDPAPPGLALLTVFEPLSLELLSFAGAGDPNEPVLRMILTTRVGVPLR